MYPTKRVAIVLTWDEGESVSTSCCGWNPERTGDGKAQLVRFSANGTEVSSANALPSFTEAYMGKTGTTPTTFNPPAYSNANHGHGVEVLGLQTNQMALSGAPTGIFGLSDPGLPGTYMNRSKYTETFINENATVLPEFAGSASPHFDAVRAMNHVYQFPAGVTHVTSAGTVTPPVTVGPDPTQSNLWGAPSAP